jgi:hypothetical protein
MAVESVSVNIVSSVDKFLQIAVDLVAALKSGKSPEAAVVSVLPEAVTALSGLGDLKTDIADRKDLETTVALKLAAIIDVLVP